MRRVVLLGVLWIASIVGLTSAGAVSNCLDENRCNHVRAIIQGPQDVSEVLQKYPGAQSVDLHGNLMEKMFDNRQQPQTAQWKKLNLSYNLLKDDIFYNMRNSQLEVVDLTYNQLQRVSVPPSVIEFIAERNKLFDITIPSGTRLQRLILPKNKFDSLNRFTNLQDLLELDLSCNDLSELNIDQLSAMWKLQTLKLARNHIHTISGSSPLQKLEYLDLSYNILTMFSDSHVIFPNVKNLYLQNNKIVMWASETLISNNLMQVNLLDNDWDCTNLGKVMKLIKRKVIPGPQTRNKDCGSENNYVCCTTSDAPYADRLIKYRKQEFKALKDGTYRRETGNHTCGDYKPNPCDGDDNRVYEMAGSAIQDLETLSKSSLQQLEQMLQQEKNTVAKLEQQVNEFSAQNDLLSGEHADLVSYINKHYKAGVPVEQQTASGKDTEVRKLQELFNYYESEYVNLKEQINAEERKNQDKLGEIGVLEGEMEDLNFRKEKLTEEVNKRNDTVNGYKAKILALQTQLG